jgi:hypothetical protein
LRRIGAAKHEQPTKQGGLVDAAQLQYVAGNRRLDDGVDNVAFPAKLVVDKGCRARIAAGVAEV